MRSKKKKKCLENEALGLPVAPSAATSVEEGGTCCVLEYLADTLVGLGRALEVLDGTNLLADLLTLFIRAARISIPIVLVWEGGKPGENRDVMKIE